jgi:hypothetical protein
MRRVVQATLSRYLEGHTGRADRLGNRNGVGVMPGAAPKLSQGNSNERDDN